MKTRASVTGWLVFILFCILGSLSLIYTVFFILIGSLKYQWCYGYNYVMFNSILRDLYMYIYVWYIFIYSSTWGCEQMMLFILTYFFHFENFCCSYMYMTAFLQYFWCISHIEFLISLLSSHCRILMPFIIIV